MAQIRIQAFCAGCNSNIDLITHPTRVGEVLNTLTATLRATHLPSCYEEDTRGQDEGSPGAGQARPGATSAPGTGDEGSKDRAPH